MFTQFPFGRAIFNSLFIAVSYTLITLVSSSMAAFAFAKLKFPFADGLFKLYLASMMIPTQVTPDSAVRDHESRPPDQHYEA